MWTLTRRVRHASASPGGRGYLLGADFGDFPFRRLLISTTSCFDDFTVRWFFTSGGHAF